METHREFRVRESFSKPLTGLHGRGGEGGRDKRVSSPTMLCTVIITSVVSESPKTHTSGCVDEGVPEGFN